MTARKEKSSEDRAQQGKKERSQGTEGAQRTRVPEKPRAHKRARRKGRAERYVGTRERLLAHLNVN